MRTLISGTAMAGAVVVVLGLTGCAGAGRTAHDAGRSAAEATAAVRTVDGVADGTVSLRNYRSGFTSTWGVTVTFTPAEDFDEVDRKAVLERLLQIGWSVDEHQIDDGVSIALDEDVEGIDLVRAADDAGLPGVGRIGTVRSRFVVSSSVLQEEFGDWPGRP